MKSRKNDPSKGGYAVRVRLDGKGKLPSENVAAKRLEKAAKPKKQSARAKAILREPTQEDLNRHMREQKREVKDRRALDKEAARKSGPDGFKDTTRTTYIKGGEEYAKGGAVKGAAKAAKVMSDFKRGVPATSREPMIKGALGAAKKR